MASFESWLQGRLTAHGFPVEQDGVWDRPDIDALSAFQRSWGLVVTGVADKTTIDALRLNAGAPGSVPAPVEKMPPWMAEMHRRMGLHEVRDNAALTAFLKIGKWLGNPKDLPWCGDAVESCIAKTLPTEPLQANPFWAQGWAKFGIDIGAPIVGAIGVIRWSASTGHVGIVAGVDGGTVNLLGGNQANSINISGFSKSKFIAFRWPKSFPVKQYPALKGRAPTIANEGATR